MNPINNFFPFLLILCIFAKLHPTLQQQNNENDVAFDEIDTNKDGKLSLDEVKAAYPHPMYDPEQLFGLWDTNKDGFVERDEFENQKGK